MMVWARKLWLLLPALVIAITGGELQVRAKAEAHALTICSEHGSYTLPLDQSVPQDEVLHLCCGDVAFGDDLAAVLPSPSAHSVSNLTDKHPAPLIQRALAPARVTAPPARGPPVWV
ncbi:MAG: hypothetical protein AAF830_00060 [Pseudomonadota bacterium]